MMARSTRSNQRPDTLTQDRLCRSTKTSCNARPDHTFESRASPSAIDCRPSISAMSRLRPKSCGGAKCRDGPKGDLPMRLPSEALPEPPWSPFSGDDLTTGRVQVSQDISIRCSEAPNIPVFDGCFSNSFNRIVSRAAKKLRSRNELRSIVRELTGPAMESMIKFGARHLHWYWPPTSFQNDNGHTRS
jgi:hypothetical protein